MRTEIKELHQRLKTTTVYVTHDQVEAMTMADKIVVMHDGVVEQVGAPLELYDRPANMFVAGFIGSPAMNFLKGRCELGRFVLEDGSALPLPDGFKHGPSGGVVYGVRPEHLVLSDDGLPLTVAVVEPTGSETQVIARHGSQSIVCIFRFCPEARAGLVAVPLVLLNSSIQASMRERPHRGPGPRQGRSHCPTFVQDDPCGRCRRGRLRNGRVLEHLARCRRRSPPGRPGCGS